MKICTFFRVTLLVFNSPSTKLFHEQIFEKKNVFRQEVVAEQCNMQFLMLTNNESNNNRTTALEWRAAMDTGGGGGGGGLKIIYWYQIFALDSVVRTKQMLSSHGGFLYIAS